MTNSRITDPEVLEQRFPVRLEQFSIRRGSGGAGQHSGGDGVVRAIRFNAAMSAAILSTHRTTEPFGVAGGKPGMVGNNRIERADGQIIQLAGRDRFEMAAGDLLVIETPGGGGFGGE